MNNRNTYSTLAILQCGRPPSSRLATRRFAVSSDTILSLTRYVQASPATMFDQITLYFSDVTLSYD